MPRYHDDFRSGRGRGAGYDLEFGNWGARSGLTGGWSRRFGGGDRYDRAFRSAPLGYDRGYGRGYDRDLMGGMRRSPAARYDQGLRGRDRYAGDFHHDSHGWGMTRLHQDMMHHHGEGFGYAGDYDRSHPARWRGEVRDEQGAPRAGWRREGRWR